VRCVARHGLTAARRKHGSPPGRVTDKPALDGGDDSPDLERTAEFRHRAAHLIRTLPELPSQRRLLERETLPSPEDVAVIIVLARQHA
jgi:hypothetical protein